MADLKKAMDIVTAQESELVFDSFDQNDAWTLGSIMAEEIKRMGVSAAVSIRDMEGTIIFQYLPVGTGAENTPWIERKFNTVKSKERSSIAVGFSLSSEDKKLTDGGLVPGENVACGGCFPIRLKSGEIVMTAIASGLTHVQDHEFVVGCLSKYLGKEVPRLDWDADLPAVLE